MEVKHVGSPSGENPGWAKRKLQDFGAFVFLAFGQEGFEPFVATITIESKPVSALIIDVQVNIVVLVDKFGLRAEDVVPVGLQLNVDPDKDIVPPTRQVVEAVRAQLACIAADARRVATSLSMFEKAAA